VSYPKHRFPLVPNQSFLPQRISRFKKASPMAISRTSKASATAKASRAITLKHLAATLAADYHLTKRSGEAVLDDLVGLITKHLKKGERVRIAGLGILQVRKRAARMGRNPATGEAIKIKASRKIAFRAAKTLKLAVA
jgi:DNA-binding protein HU-beta